MIMMYDVVLIKLLILRAKHWVSEERGPPSHTRLEAQVRPNLIFGTDYLLAGAEIEQSVWRMATGWTAQGSEFESR
jgi:hypothetical protein